MSEDKSLDYKKRFSSELTTLPVFRDDQMWNNGDLVGPDLQVFLAFIISLHTPTYSLNYLLLYKILHNMQILCELFSKSPFYPPTFHKTHTHIHTKQLIGNQQKLFAIGYFVTRSGL